MVDDRRAGDDGRGQADEDEPPEADERRGVWIHEAPTPPGTGARSAGGCLEQVPPAHGCRDVEPEQIEDGRRDVEEVHVLSIGDRNVGTGQDQEAVLGVIGIVGPGVVVERVDALVAADRADCPPVEVAEVDDEVGGDAVHLSVDVLRPEDLRVDRVSVLVRDSGECPRRDRRGQRS